MTSESEEWSRLYTMQHRIWPSWSVGDGDANSVAEFVSSITGLGPGHVIDLGCGSARELAAFGRRGWTGLGIDAAEIIDVAKHRIGESGLEERIDLVDSDFTALNRSVADADLLLLWDSTLAIFDKAQQQKILELWAKRLHSGGFLVVGQLSYELFSLKKGEKVVFSGSDIGPGKTVRTYNWSDFEHALTDDVVWYPEEGSPVKLPTQTLYLLAVEELINTLEAVGLLNVRALGSDGWNWSYPGQQVPNINSMQVVVYGRKA